jgi:hypothetical protein
VPSLGILRNGPNPSKEESIRNSKRLRDKQENVLMMTLMSNQRIMSFYVKMISMIRCKDIFS